MKADPEAIAARLSKAPRDPAALAAALDTIEKGGGERLFCHFFNVVRQETPNATRHVHTSMTMALLEQMMDEHPAVGGYMMAKLYPIAGKAKDHTTFNAIELWMDQSSSSELAKVIDGLVREPTRQQMRMRYQAWSAAIRQKLQR